jgi:hypothetical protein
MTKKYTKKQPARLIAPAQTPAPPVATTGPSATAGKPEAKEAPGSPKGRGKGDKRLAPAKAKSSKAPRTSGLDAAAKVLASAREPMRCGDLVKRMLDKGLWKTGGRTPAATINAAIIREIRAKGRDSRFKRSGRGLFAASGA